MTSLGEPGYDSVILMDFLNEHGERFNGRLLWLNEERLTESHRDMLERWATWDTVPLRKVDPFLMQYDLMLFELEAWAQKYHGWDGFCDPYEEPAGLVG